jgi:outer membrane protein assembly factor BamB
MRITVKGWLVFLTLAGIAIGNAGASDWPRFRGPNGTGIATDQDIPAQWTENNGVLWKSAIRGAGNSSPIVWGNRVFLQSASIDGKERLLLCLDAADGKMVWSRSIPGSKAYTHPKNTFASSTPATDGERVYCLFWDGDKVAVYAFDFQGRRVWQKDLGTFTSQHGPGTSPIIFAGKVYLANDQDQGPCALICLDAKRGRELWQVQRQAFRACYSTPFVRENGRGDPEIIVASTAGISGYNPQTGKENWAWRWTFDGMALRTVASPIESQGIIFANSGDGSGARHTIAVELGRKGDAAAPRLIWENKKNLPYPYVPTMVPWGEYLFSVHDKGIASCLVAKTGKAVWSERLGGEFSASPILIDGKIYAVNEDGEVYVFPTEPTFHLSAKNTIGEPVKATPAVAGGRLFIRGKEHLFCIGKSAGK